LSRTPICLALASLVLLAACNSDARQLLEQAEARWREGNYDDAIRLNTLLYQRERGGAFAAKALLNIGNIYYLNLRQIKDAVETYNKLLIELPGSPEECKARQQLATIYANEIGDLNQAILEYDKILESPELENPLDVEFQRASAYFRKGDYDRALRDLRRIEEQGISGHLAHQVYLKIGNIYQLQNRFDAAVAVFEKVSGSACIECRRRALVHLMESHESLYDFDAAIKSVRKLDSPENDSLIAREVTRLSERRRQLGSGTELNWIRGSPKPRPATP
jgi:tetratricopeptide (TPR) repeat protein